jgi:hypothetical protein
VGGAGVEKCVGGEKGVGSEECVHGARGTGLALRGVCRHIQLRSTGWEDGWRSVDMNASSCSCGGYAKGDRGWREQAAYWRSSQDQCDGEEDE